MPDLNYYRLYYVIRRIRNEITSILGASMKWVNAVNLGLELCLFTSLLISSSATMNYLMKAGKNLIFLSTPVQFIVNLVAMLASYAHVPRHVVSYFW